jgi:hypothetical protein
MNAEIILMIESIQTKMSSFVTVSKLRRIRPVKKYACSCFIEALSCCLGKTYCETFKLVHPNKSIEIDCHGVIPSNGYEVASKHLRMFTETPIRELKKLAMNALITIRWEAAPDLGHTMVWEIIFMKLWMCLSVRYLRFIILNVQ